MTTFTLDTSGAIPMPSAHGGTVPFRWGGLDPFTQGYVEALLRALTQSMIDDPDMAFSLEQCRRASRFTYLAPEALAAILKDCEAALEGSYAGSVDLAHEGAAFWLERQTGMDNFPRLTPYLGNDSKIYLR